MSHGITALQRTDQSIQAATVPGHQAILRRQALASMAIPVMVVVETPLLRQLPVLLPRQLLVLLRQLQPVLLLHPQRALLPHQPARQLLARTLQTHTLVPRATSILTGLPKSRPEPLR